MILKRFQCRDCKHEYTDYAGDRCPECGGAMVIQKDCGEPPGSMAGSASELTTEYRGLKQTLDSPKMAVGFLSDVLVSMYDLWDRMPHEAVEMTVELTLEPAEKEPKDDD